MVEYSCGLLFDIDVEVCIVKFFKEYILFLKLLILFQGFMQMFLSGNIFVGWGYIVVWIEFFVDGEVFCEIYILLVWFVNFGWVKSY